MRIFAFVAAQKAELPVRTLCRVCKVSTSGFYAFCARKAAGPTRTELKKAAFARHVARVHKSSRRRYGSPRVTAQLAREGITVNHKKVEREMARQGLVGRSSRKKVRTTRRDPSKVPAADLVERDFDRDHVDELWIGDATYVPTDEGWCYLATVIDACSRRLLGWSITDHLRTELCLDALEMAVATRGGRRNLVTGVVFHTDHGTQGGINWSSQHLDHGGVHETTVRMDRHDRGSPSGAQKEPTERHPYISGTDSLPGCADDRLAGRPGSVLGSDRSRPKDRCRRHRGGCLIPRRIPVVPPRWGCEPSSSANCVRPLPVICRTRGHRHLACAGARRA